MSGYHHGNLRAALVESAVALGREKGPDGVVLRETARLSGVSHNAAYRHFADRGELLAEVAAVGLAELATAMLTRLGRVRASAPGEKARRRLRATGRAYVEYALAQPGMFRVAFACPTTPPDLEVGPYELLNQVLDECVEAGVVPRSRRPGADVACWAAVHGFAVLHLDGPLREAPVAERERELEQMLQTLEWGLAAQ